MSQDRTDLIDRITRQFKAQITPSLLRKMHLTSGYFNTGLPLNYKHRVTDLNDKGFLGRIFDTVKLDRKTTEQFYAAIMQAKDPVQDILVPLLGSISEQIFDPDLPQLHVDIRNDFKNYEAVRQKYSDDEFQKIMLKAVLSACAAMLMDLQTSKTSGLRTKDPDAELRLNQSFSAKVTMPFDAYSMNLTKEKLKLDLETFKKKSQSSTAQIEQPTRNWFITMLIRALLSVVNIFSRQPHEESDTDSKSHIEMRQIVVESEIEKKVVSLVQVLDQILDVLEPACGEDESNKVLLKQVITFRDNITALQTEIADKREMGLDVETTVGNGFDGLCSGFSQRMNDYIQKQPPLGVGAQEAMVAVVRDLVEKINPHLENSEKKDLPDSNTL